MLYTSSINCKFFLLGEGSEGSHVEFEIDVLPAQSTGTEAAGSLAEAYQLLNKTAIE